MNCPKCQTPVPAGTAFCPTCGKPMPAPKPAKKQLPLPLIAGGAGAIVIAIILIIIFGGSGAKSVVANDFKAIEKEDGKYIYQNVPKLYLDYENEKADEKDVKDEDGWIQHYDNKLDDTILYREAIYGKNFREDLVEDYEIVKVRKVDKKIVEKFNEYLDKESKFKEVYNEKEHKITAANIIEVRTETVFDGKRAVTYDFIVAVKEDGKWKDASLIGGGYKEFSWEVIADEAEDKD